MTIRGQVDGLEGAYVVGWAVRDDGGECTISVQTPAGVVVGEGRASRNRPDLSKLGVGKTNIAFRIPVSDLGAHSTLKVFADDTELSVLLVGPGLFNGAFTVRAGIADGWVTERIANFLPPLVTILDQHGRCVGEAHAAFPEDAYDVLFTPAEFLIELDDSCFGRPDLKLTACANGAAFATRACNLRLQGALETLSETKCSGWLFSPDAPDRALSIEVYVNGEKAAQTRCDIHRADVTAAFPVCKMAGFDVSLPYRFRAATELTTASLRLKGSELDLLEGPYVIGPTAAIVSAARRLAQSITAASPPFAQADLAVMQSAIAGLLAKTRQGTPFLGTRQFIATAGPARPRLNIIIPIYRDTRITADCIHSVLDHRNQQLDRIILVNDLSPEPDMAAVLNYFATHPNVHLLTNETNLGFIGSVNRGLRFCDIGDVILLNSDTEVFPGGIDELWRVAHSVRNIGTVTAISNNATIFSYPHVSLRAAVLEDIAMVDLAATALEYNRGMAIDVPTGHGFCMLITREVLNKVGLLDEAFGRGYGEENDFCGRAADLGYRNVAAPGAFVRHRESISFLGDKSELLKTNLTILNGRYPEYTPTIMETERSDPLRVARWPLDIERLRRAGAAGATFAVVVSHSLGGGTHKAIQDIEDAVGYGGARKIGVTCRVDGFIEVTCESPAIHAIFAATEASYLFELLSAAPVSVVAVHQLLGFTVGFVTELSKWVAQRNAIFYGHDFYTICPRVTMIDAAGEFCNVAAPEICRRCIAIGGAHEGSRTLELSAEEHRPFFASVLSSFRHVVTPSTSAADYLQSAIPELGVTVIPHPEPKINFPTATRIGTDDEVVLLGALGPHKGSRKLLEVAHRAQLVAPNLRFRVIGFTDIDDQLKALGNVTITGRYRQADVARHLRAARGRLALFLPVWPETYGYTLTEVVSEGFIPFVPDIGAPADRVRDSGFGVIFTFPADPIDIVRAITDFAAGKRELYQRTATPTNFAMDTSVVHMTAQLMSGGGTRKVQGYQTEPSWTGVA